MQKTIMEPVGGEFALSVAGYIVTFIITMVSAGWSMAWKLSAVRRDIDKKIDKVEFDMNTRLNDQFDSSNRLVGESLAAIRQKSVDTELWVRDNLVRRQDFQMTIEGLGRALESIRVDINSNYRELNSKLDRLVKGPKERDG